MISAVQFAMLRLVVVSVAVLSQIYLVWRLRRALAASCLSRGCQSWIVRGAAALAVLLFALNAYILCRPLEWLKPSPAAEFFLLYPSAIWSFGSIFSALLLGLLQVLAWLGRLTARGWRQLTGPRSGLPFDLERRRFLQTGVSGFAAAPLILSGYGAAYASKAYEVKELTLPFGRPLRVVQLTDIHAGLYMTREEMRHFADRINALQPDLFALTGDYVSNSIQYLPECVEEMARVRTRYGAFAAMGNHDRWYGEAQEIVRLFERRGIKFLLNAHRVIQTAHGSLAVAGIDDLIAGSPDLPAALHGLPAGLPTLLLSHRPEIFPQAAGRGIPLTLAGHYHGGQIKLCLPGMDLSLAHLRTPYPEGLFRLKRCHLYVSRGIGTTFTPVRLNARPEVTLLHLV